MIESEANSETAQYMSRNLIIGAFVVAYAGKYVLVSQQNQVQVSKSIESSEKVPFEHPFFQMLASYLGEFIFTIFYYIYKTIIWSDQVQKSEIRYVQFIYPALCDFTQNLLFIFGISMMLPQMSIATKALALPISAFFCRWSLLKIRKSFNMKQSMALFGIMVSVTIIFIISSSDELKLDGSEAIKKEQEQMTGLIMLGFSACFQAFEVCLENRLFMIEPDLTALSL